QLPERMPPEIGELWHVRITGGNGEVLPSPTLDEEGDRLVERPFHVELDLRVLVGYAERFDGCWTGMDFHSLARVALPETLGPELTEPIGDVAKRIGVGHHHMDRRVQLLIGEVLQRRIHPRWISQEVARTTALVHGLRPLQQLPDRNSGHGSGE